MKIIAPMAVLATFLVVFSCNKSNEDAKVCYECISYTTKTYKSGQIQKDTGSMFPCQTNSFIEAYLKTTNGEKDSFEVKINGGVRDTLYYHFQQKTVCNKR